MDNVDEGLPLSEVIINLNDESKKRDPERRDQFHCESEFDLGRAAGACSRAIDPAMDCDSRAAPAEAIDVDVGQTSHR
jgi:hypothetical protein